MVLLVRLLDRHAIKCITEIYILNKQIQYLNIICHQKLILVIEILYVSLVFGG